MSDKPSLVNTQWNIEDVRRDLEQLRSDMAQLADSITKTARQGARGAAADAKVAAAQVGDLAGEHYATVRERIRDQPVTACAIAAGVGLLLGQILRR